MRSTKATYIARRKHQPDDLYILIADLPNKHAGSTPDILAPRRFIWSDITRAQIESHMAHHPMLAHTSPFLSAHIDLSRALEILELDYRKRISPTTTDIIKINSRALVPAWAYTQNDDKIPMWIEQGKLPQLPKGVLSMTTTGFDAFESSCWICVDEVRDLLNIDDDVGSGQWLACGRVPARMVYTRDSTRGTERETDMLAEAAKNMDIVAHKKAHTISRKKVPVRTSSLHLPTKGKKEDLKTEQATVHESPVQTKKYVGAQETMDLEQKSRTQQSSNIEQEQSVNYSIHPPTPPRNPHRPHDLPAIPGIALNTITNIPAPERPRKSSIQPHDLPNTISVRDFAPLPSIILTPPTPQPLLYSAVDVISQHSDQSAATLAKLEDVALRGAALRQWMEESKEKHRGLHSGLEGNEKAENERVQIERDVWSRG